MATTDSTRITKLALAALATMTVESSRDGSNRRDFLASLPADDRNTGARQYDRLVRLARFDDPTRAAIRSEAIRLAVLDKMDGPLNPYGADLIDRATTGRIMSEGQRRAMAQIGESITEDDIDQHEATAIENLTAEKRHLQARTNTTA